MKICPYCRSAALEEEGNVIYCNSCGTPHHSECYDENGGCTLFGCASAPPDEPKVQVSNMEVVRVAAPSMPPAFSSGPLSRPTGFGDASAPIARTPQSFAAAGQSLPGTSTPPPPPRASAPPPPPPPLGTLPPVPVRTPVATVPAGGPPSTGINNAGQAAAPVSTASPDTSVAPSYLPSSGMFAKAATNVVVSAEPKSRLTFILLGIFLGVFGAHNFYAGYWKRGVGQLCVTLLTFFYGAFISLVWAIVEVCTVEHDSRNIQFS